MTLTKTKTRVAFIPSDMDAPGSYRCLFPGRQLGQHSYEVVMPDKNIVEGDDGKRRFNFNVGFDPITPAANLWVIQSRFERMWGEEALARLRMNGVAVIADVDDNYEELPAWNPAFLGTHPYRRDDGVIVNRAERRKLAKQIGFKVPPNKKNRWHLREMLKRVDALTVSTPYLAELYSQYAPEVHVIRNSVDWDMWENITPQYDVDRGGRVRIGYTGVWSYRQADIALLKNVVRPILDKYPHVDFVANNAKVHDFLNVPLGRRVTIPEYDFLNIDTNEYEMPTKTATMDIGLVPLVRNGLNEGKSHLKGMELNAAGIPYIASGTESYRWYTNDDNGFIANSDREFRDRLCELIEDNDLRHDMGWKGRLLVQHNHTVQENWHQWADVYDNVVGGGYKKLARYSIAHGAVQKVTELEWLLAQAATTDMKVIVEIGSASGGTFWAFAKIADPHALIVSIDMPSGSPIDVNGGKDVYAGRDRERMRLYVSETQRCRLIDGNSQEQETFNQLIDTLGVWPIDFLFIDADHRYEGVKRDYDMYSPLVRPGGLIGFHDIIPQNDRRSGVHKLWAELKQTEATLEFVGNDSFAFGSWGGVGVVRK
jgi:glycosyltransferase involved in cell wall biosynthesis